MARMNPKEKSARREYARAKADTEPGEGSRFAALEKSIEAHGGARDPGAIAAAIGRKKFGAKRFAKMGSAGRKKG